MGSRGAIYEVMCWYIVYNLMAEQWGGSACGIFRLVTVYSSTAGKADRGAVTIYRVLAIYLYRDIIYNIASQHRAPPTGSGHGGALGARYTTASHNISHTHRTQGSPPSPELRNARVRVSRACVRACVRVYYYIIIIL